MSTSAGRIGAIIGPARSGTTWAGTLVDSCPDVIYRFEPFRRLSATRPQARKWFDDLKDERVTERDTPELYSLLKRAHPATNKPPFFETKSYRQRQFGREVLWPASRLMPPLAKLYGVSYTPRDNAPLVFKEVTFIRPLRNLLQRTTIPVAYMVRHPCATVLSEVDGQRRGVMPSGRQENLGEILQRFNPELAMEFKGIVNGSDVIERTALLWRCEVEACVPVVTSSSGGYLFTYEQLALDTAEEARKLLLHFGLHYSEQTASYIESLQSISSDFNATSRRTGWGRKYFSVYRNPNDQHDAWKRKITAVQRQKIESVVRGSKVFEMCASIGRWS